MRSWGLISALTCLALAVVYLRVEQARTAARTLALETRWMELRRELWSVQTGVARLRSPARLYDSLNFFEADLVTRNLKANSNGGLRFAGNNLRD